MEELLLNGWFWLDKFEGKIAFDKKLNSCDTIRLEYADGILECYIMAVGRKLFVCSGVVKLDAIFKERCNEIYKEGIKELFLKNIL